MRRDDRPTEEGRSESATEPSYRRRGFLALGAGASAALLAGCAGGSNGTESTPSASGGADGPTGTFRLLISDQPVAIDEFDELNVSFDRARVFRGEPTEEGTAGTATPSPEPPETATATATPTATAEPTTEARNGDGEERDFFTIDLDGATVDLTRVVGERAIGVFDGQLPEGRYAKVELYASDVGGIVDGESVTVTIPSEKLQIVKPFEVVAGETLRFVFDINVVKRGRTGGYNLLPVISESGVAGRDVEVTEIGRDGTGRDADASGDGNASDGEEGGGAERGSQRRL